MLPSLKSKRRATESKARRERKPCFFPPRCPYYKTQTPMMYFRREHSWHTFYSIPSSPFSAALPSSLPGCAVSPSLPSRRCSNSRVVFTHFMNGRARACSSALLLLLLLHAASARERGRQEARARCKDNKRLNISFFQSYYIGDVNPHISSKDTVYSISSWFIAHFRM